MCSQHLVRQHEAWGAVLRCRGLFATHYHRLADAHARDPSVSIRHMACHVSSDQAGREQVPSVAPASGICTARRTLQAAHASGMAC